MINQHTIRLAIILLIVFGSLIGVSAWLQFGVLAKSEREFSAENNQTSDYDIENFTSTGIDRLGKKYWLSADRLEYFSLPDHAELERPYVIQYDSPDSPRHIKADSGLLYNEGTVMLLYGNVKVEQHDEILTTADRMVIRLADVRDN